MNIRLWRQRGPVDPGISRLRDEMDRTLDRFIAEPLGLRELEPALRTEGWLPPLDVSETENEVTIRAEVPGIAAKDLDISVTDSTLTLTGEKEEKSEKEDENFYRCERRFGSFRRVVELPDTADPDRVSAETDNGVLLIHVAKKPGAKPRHIEVRPGNRKVPVAG